MIFAAVAGSYSGRATPSLRKTPQRRIVTTTGRRSTYQTPKSVRTNPASSSLGGARPDALDTLDVDVIIDRYADMLGVTPQALTPPDQLAAVRAQKAQAAQQALMAKTAMAAVQGAKTLSETEVGGGANALQKMMGN